MEKRICSKCEEPKSIGEFAKHTASTGGRRHVCKVCCNKSAKVRAETNRNKGLCACGRELLVDRKLCGKCTERLNTRQKSNRNRGLCRCGRALIEGNICEDCRQRSKNWARQLKADTMQAYGGMCQCGCGCTVSDLEYLTLDHVHGGGRKHRASIGVEGSGMGFYSYLKKRGYPQEGLRAMCWNCNCARGMYGYCPKSLGGKNGK